MPVKGDMKKKLLLIVRAKKVNVDTFARQHALLSNFYDVDVFSFNGIPLPPGFVTHVFSSGTTVQNFVAQIPKKTYELGMLYIDDNSNAYTMEQNLKKLGMKLLKKTVIQEETTPIKEEKEDEQKPNPNRQSFVL